MKSDKSLDFRNVFEGLPGAYLILSPEFTMLAASNAYLDASLMRREQILGRNVFEVFPDNPNDPTADGVANLTESLNKVLSTKKPHAMRVQRYDILLPEKLGGGWEKRYWRPINSPIFNDNGEVAYIAHHVEDVTSMVDTLEAAMDEQHAIQKKSKGA